MAGAVEVDRGYRSLAARGLRMEMVHTTWGPLVGQHVYRWYTAGESDGDKVCNHRRWGLTGVSVRWVGGGDTAAVPGADREARRVPRLHTHVTYVTGACLSALSSADMWV